MLKFFNIVQKKFFKFISKLIEILEKWKSKSLKRLSYSSFVLLIFAIFQVCKFAIFQICKFAIFQICKFSKLKPYLDLLNYNLFKLFHYLY